jgi:hypothetical protein
VTRCSIAETQCTVRNPQRLDVFLSVRLQPATRDLMKTNTQLPTSALWDGPVFWFKGQSHALDFFAALRNLVQPILPSWVLGWRRQRQRHEFKCARYRKGRSRGAQLRPPIGSRHRRPGGAVFTATAGDANCNTFSRAPEAPTGNQPHQARRCRAPDQSHGGRSGHFEGREARGIPTHDSKRSGNLREA